MCGMSVSGERKGECSLVLSLFGKKNLVETKLSILLASASGKTCRHYSILINAIANILLYWFSEFYSSEEGR